MASGRAPGCAPVVRRVRCVIKHNSAGAAHSKRLRAAEEIAHAHARLRPPRRPSTWPTGTDTAANPVARPAKRTLGRGHLCKPETRGRQAPPASHDGRSPHPTERCGVQPETPPFLPTRTTSDATQAEVGTRSLRARRTHCLGAGHPTDLPVLQCACLYALARQVRTLTEDEGRGAALLSPRWRARAAPPAPPVRPLPAQAGSSTDTVPACRPRAVGERLCRLGRRRLRPLRGTRSWRGGRRGGRGRVVLPSHVGYVRRLRAPRGAQRQPAFRATLF